jgi:ATP-dependent Clp protease ATP-binding subunit ClpX|tara:strand:+ start:886 stop:2169 length:1284 start_codon:yes stop_codon:yes gene_type:complete
MKICTLCNKSYDDPNDIRGYPGDHFGYPEVKIFFCINCSTYIHKGFSLDNSLTINQTDNQSTNLKILHNKPPKEISSQLSEYVIGQEHAKKVISVAVYNHYKRLQPNETKDVDIQKSNILLVGPTGSGKTYLAQTLSKILDVPFSISDATSLTEAGYVGEDVENILLRLYQAADGNINKTQQGIIYIDEIDKIAKKNANPSLTKELGEGTQQSLLKILEGSVVNVPRKGGRKHPEQDFLQVDTSGILFILGGAFEGLDKIVDKRINNKTIGFENISNEKENFIKDDRYIESEDILKYGFIPEFIGRVASIVSLNNLNHSDLLSILKEPKNSLVKQYQKLFELDGVELKFTKESLEQIANEALLEKNGARALKSIIEKILMDVMFEIPSIENVSRSIVHYDNINKVHYIELLDLKGKSIKNFESKKVA